MSRIKEAIGEIQRDVGLTEHAAQVLQKTAGAKIRELVMNRVAEVVNEARFPYGFAGGLFDWHDEPGVLVKRFEEEYRAAVLYPDGLYSVPMGDSDNFWKLLVDKRREADDALYLECGTEIIDALEFALLRDSVLTRTSRTSLRKKSR